jgi:hypothetical protein
MSFFFNIFIAHINCVFFYLTKYTLPNFPYPNYLRIVKFYNLGYFSNLVYFYFII